MSSVSKVDLSLDEIIALNKKSSMQNTPGRGRGRGQRRWRGRGRGGAGKRGGGVLRGQSVKTQANSGGVTQVRTQAQQRSQQRRQKARDAVLAQKRKLSNASGDGGQPSPSTSVSAQRGKGRGRGRRRSGGGRGRGGGGGGGVGIASRLGRGGGLISPSRLASGAGPHPAFCHLRSRAPAPVYNTASNIKLGVDLKMVYLGSVHGMGSARGRRGEPRGNQGAEFVQQTVEEEENMGGGNVEVGGGWRARRRGRGGRGRGQQRSDDTRQMPTPGKLQIAVLHEPEMEPMGVDLAPDFAVSHHTNRSLHSRFTPGDVKTTRMVLPDGRAVRYQN